MRLVDFDTQVAVQDYIDTIDVDTMRVIGAYNDEEDEQLSIVLNSLKFPQGYED
jgi:hypothetical protein